MPDTARGPLSHLPPSAIDSPACSEDRHSRFPDVKRTRFHGNGRCFSDAFRRCPEARDAATRLARALRCMTPYTPGDGPEWATFAPVFAADAGASRRVESETSRLERRSMDVRTLSMIDLYPNNRANS